MKYIFIQLLSLISEIVNGSINHVIRDCNGTMPHAEHPYQFERACDMVLNTPCMSYDVASIMVSQFNHCVFICILVGQVEYCPWESFSATCESNEIVVMQTARYGRMRLGRCVKNDLGYVGCFTDVLDIADKWCSGRHACEIPIPNAELDNLTPCLEDLKSYFEASYKCLKGKQSFKYI